MSKKHEIINKSKLDVNSSCVLLAEFHVNLLSDQLLILANLQIVLMNISKIPYQCITNFLLIIGVFLLLDHGESKRGTLRHPHKAWYTFVLITVLV